MKYKKMIYKKAPLMLITAILLVGGCNKNEFEDLTADLTREVKIESFDVQQALRVDLNEAGKTIVVTFEGGSDITAVVPSFTVSDGAIVFPEPGTAMDMRSPVTLTVKNGNLFSTYSISAKVLAVTALLSHHASVNDIQDDDEKAFAEWFFNTYEAEVSEFVSFQAIKDGTVDLNKYKTLTWYLDGNADEFFEMPAIALDPDVLTKVSDYYKAGGNLYLMGFAGQFLMELGRFPDNKYFMAIGGGQGFENGDTWGIGTSILARDESGHPIYNGIPLTVNGSRKTFPVLGPGWREDHNYVIVRIPEVYGMNNDDVNAYDKFNQENGTRWLGVWDGIGDYFMAGIVEFLPKDDYNGRAIFQGIGALEWNQNAKGTINVEGANAYQANIEKLSSNTISYLSLN